MSFPFNGTLQGGTRVGLPNNDPMPVGSVPITEYLVANGNFGNPVCCYDYGEAEADFADNGNGHMFALGISRPMGSPQSEYIDMENGGVNPGVNQYPIDTILAKTDGVSTYVFKNANGQTGPWASTGVTALPPQYQPLHLEGGFTWGLGGDGSGLGSVQSAIFEGAIFAQQTSDATDNAILSSIVQFYGP